jgi:hypothetical protein
VKSGRSYGSNENLFKERKIENNVCGDFLIIDTFKNLKKKAKKNAQKLKQKGMVLCLGYVD